MAAYRKQVLQAGADVEAALSNMTERRMQAEAAQRAEKASLHYREAAEAAHAAGHLGALDSLGAHRRLLQARDRRLIADTEAARAKLAVIKALGGGWAG
jgi:outer membrane protein TolC